MNCNQLRELFSEYATGSLPRALSNAVRDHFTECPECKDTYSEFTSTLKILESVVDVKSPPNLHEVIMAAVRESQSESTSSSRSGWFTRVRNLIQVPVQLPARALATGVALLAVFAVVNGFFPIKPALDSVLQTDNRIKTVDRAIVASAGDRSTGDGLSMVVKSASPSVLSISLKSVSGESSAYKLVYLTGGQAVSGNIQPGSSSVVQVQSAGNGVCVARLEHFIAGSKIDRNIFMPGRLDPVGSAKKIDVAVGGGSAMETLKSIASAYGVAIIASGDMSAPVPAAGIAHGTPDDAFYNTLARAGYSWRQINSSVYLVEPSS